jgi:nucleoside-diphosphate-sugar epimerase|tara:strand:- start:2096 stop:2428 length:333 start_codon:yes stop_codon:yes gene_type:complete
VENIERLVEGTIRAMKNEKAVGEIINIGNNEEISVLKSANVIHKLARTGKDLRLIFIPYSDIFCSCKDIEKRKPDLSKAKSLLGYEPKVPFSRGIELTINTMKKLNVKYN